MNKKKCLVVGGMVLIASLGQALAQSNEDISSVLQFNFSNPGARSLGMAGAFTARADDATAVYANPAGLIQLSRPELSIEGRGWEYSNRFLDGGVQEDVSSLDGLIYDETDDSTAGLSFLSGFYPSKSGRWVLGIFHHQAVNYETTLSSDNATVFTFFDDRTPTGLARPLDGFLDLSIDTLGASFAIELGANISIGATLARSEFEFDSRLELHDSARDEEFGDPIFFPGSVDEPFPDITEGDPELCCEFANRGDIVRFRTQQGDDDDLSFNLGLFWESKKTKGGVPLAAVGAVYRHGAEFSFRGNAFVRTMSGPLPATRTYEPNISNGRGVFHVPDVLGIGASVRPSKRWVISLDYDRVNYEDLNDDFLDLAADDSGIPDGETGTPADYELEDGDEYRLGFEFVVNPDRGSPLWFLRGGAWHDPNHEIEYDGPSPSRRPIFSPGDDEIHYTLGAGVKFRDFQIDAAADLSDRVNTVSLSAVFYFGRD